MSLRKSIAKRQRMDRLAYPKVAQKWRIASLLRPEAFTKAFPQRPSTLKKAILVFNPLLVEAIGQELDLRSLHLPYETHLSARIDKGNKAMVALLGVGSPSAAIAVEEFASWGIEQFLILGFAGSLKPGFGVGETVLCTKAVREEGTSYHYAPASLYSYPSSYLTRALADALESEGVKFTPGPTWTTDALYRETLSEAKLFRSLGVLTADMEASATFAVAETRGVEAAAVFSIADTLGTTWSGFQITETGRERLARVGSTFVRRVRLKRER